MKILVADPVGQSGIELLMQKGHVVDQQPTISAQDLILAIPHYDCLIVRGRTQVTRDVVHAGIRLRVIGKCGAGTDNIDLAATKEKRICVVNAPGTTSQSVAEHTIALMFALSRSLITTVQSMRQGKWEKSRYSGIELKGKTLGIVGYGHIGSIVARIAQSIGMHILIHTRTPVGGMECVSFDSLIARADVISIHVPLTEQTKGFVNSSAFSKMKRTTVLINTSRGAVVDEIALIDALQHKKIAGAALDVYATEPLDPHSTLRTLENVVLTPHVAAASPEGQDRASYQIAQDIIGVFQGNRAMHEVSIG